jgi:plasmid stabilization system protein ParE
MIVRILSAALEDLVAAFEFYEEENPGIGVYFLDELEEEIDELSFQAGIHPIHFGFYHVKYSHRFPYAIYYYIAEHTVFVDAVLDTRQHPGRTEKRLKKS